MIFDLGSVDSIPISETLLGGYAVEDTLLYTGLLT